MNIRLTRLALGLFATILVVSTLTARAEDCPKDTSSSAFKKIKLGFPHTDSAQPGCFKVYVPDKWGGLLTVKIVTGTVEGFYPDLKTTTGPPAAEIKIDVKEDKHGWYYLIVTGQKQYTVENTFVQDGQSKTIPWNFWYFPYDPSAGLRHLYDSPGAYTKYDAVFSEKGLDWEVTNHKKAGFSWAGHCGGAATASILYQDPQAIVQKGQSFDQDDLEGLLAELGSKSTDTDLEGGRGTSAWPADKPKDGKDPTDKYADNFQNRLREFLRQKKKAILADLRDRGGSDAGEVWNQAIYKYQASYKEAPGDDEKVVTIENTFTSNDDFLTGTPPESTGDPETGKKREEVAVYVLEYKADGEIAEDGKKQDWQSLKLGTTDVYLPRYLKDVNFPIKAAGRGNPIVTEANMKTLGAKQN